MKSDEVIFRVSKGKVILSMLIAIGLLAALSWFLSFVIALPHAFNRTFLLIWCSILALILIWVISVFSRELVDSEQGITINDKGIKIDRGVNKGHFIDWSEVTDFQINGKQGLFLLIFIRNPNKLLDETQGLQKFWLKMNNISHKTPVSLSASRMNCSFETLVDTVIDRFEKYNESQQQTIR